MRAERILCWTTAVILASGCDGKDLSNPAPLLPDILASAGGLRTPAPLSRPSACGGASPRSKSVKLVPGARPSSRNASAWNASAWKR